jgi:transposase
VDRASLEELLGQGLSLAEIGRRFDRHESTVGYWVQKYGLEAAGRARHSAKGGLARDVLEPLVEAGMSIAGIAAALGRSKASVRHWLTKYALRSSGQPGRGSREGAREARNAGLLRVAIPCPRHGETEHVRAMARSSMSASLAAITAAASVARRRWFDDGGGSSSYSSRSSVVAVRSADTTPVSPRCISTTSIGLSRSSA